MAIIWADIADDDGVLPPRQVIGPDEKGIKKVIDYKFDDENNTVAITTTIRVRKLNQRAAERRSWPKFVDAVPAVPADDNSRLTMVSTEEIFLERPKRAPGTKPEETTATGDSLAQLGKGGGALMVCRTCFKKGDHWTAMCPYKKDLAAVPEGSIENPTTSDSAAASGSGKSAYVPPSMRAGAERTGTDMRRRNDDNSVRVNNLSEDTREADLRELFEPFGAVTRAYVAIDQKTGMSRGFGFVSFVNKEDAQRAINKLNGYGYDNLILRVEWAAPRAN